MKSTIMTCALLAMAIGGAWAAGPGGFIFSIGLFLTLLYVAERRA